MYTGILESFTGIYKHWNRDNVTKLTHIIPRITKNTYFRSSLIHPIEFSRVENPADKANAEDPFTRPFIARARSTSRHMSPEIETSFPPGKLPRVSARKHCSRHIYDYRYSLHTIFFFNLKFRNLSRIDRFLKKKDTTNSVNANENTD